ncbi:MAG: HAD family phosphatase [Caldilineaceae bacterium]|nr:HAD family phosphatase [Caldilineaceae bacterium]
MKAVLFDLGRVLVDYDHQATVAAVAAQTEAGLAAVQALMTTHATALGVGDLNAEEFYQLLVAEVGLRSDFLDFIDCYAQGIQRNESALAYAVELQQRPGVTVAVLSNTNDAHVRWLDQHVPELIEFELVMMSNEVAVLKPDAAIFELAMELLNVLPEQCIFIDDIAANVVAAQQLGMAGIVHHDWVQTRPVLEAWLSKRD